MKASKFFLLVFLVSSVIFAQHSGIFIPRNVKKSYERGIRNYNGTPGSKYWQNSANYFITVRVVPKTKEVIGREEIIYSNNSPDELNELVFRLYPDYYKKGAPRDDQIYPRAVNEGMRLKYLIINEDTVDLSSQNKNFKRWGTNAFVFLNNPIPAGGKAVVEAAWSFTLPTYSKQRLGVYDSTSFFVAYWYPQISVYDDIDGWDTYNYGGTVEFYNDFNNYNVEITVPEGFIVWATGVVRNLNDLLKPKFLKRIEKARSSDKPVHILTKEDYAEGSPTIVDNYNTWIFNANNVTDFTFATSNHYLWDMGSVVVDSLTKRRVVVNAAYKESSEEFKRVAEIGIKTIDYLSHVLPAVPFPYPKLTVFNGGGGMESPMMVNEGSSSSFTGQFFVTSHEITHTYFPFYMGINERKYAWMDEGMATMLPMELQKENGKFDPLVGNVRGFSVFAGNETELPMMIPSVFLFGRTYRNASYGRPGIAFYYLRDLLGKEKFKLALDRFIERWHGKHPLPYDFFFTFNDITGENLDWYWLPWFFNNGYPDLSLEKTVQKEGKVIVTVKKVGELPVPIDLKLTFEDDSQKEIWKTASVWKNSNVTEIVVKTKKKIKKAELLTEKVPDVNEDNNVWESK